MRVAVMGGGGFLGSNFCSGLRKSFDCTIFTKEINDRIRDFDLEKNTVELDLVNFDQRKLLEFGDFDTVVYMATRLHALNKYKPDLHQDYKINVETPLKILDYYKYRNKEIDFIYISSLLVYGSQKISSPLSEDSFPRPDTNYAVAKRIAELELKNRFWSYHNIFILRPSFIYGPKQHVQNAIPSIIRKLLKDEPIVLTTGGMEWRDDIYVDDISKAIFACLIHSSGGKVGVYNVGGGKAITLINITRKICDILGKNFDSLVGFNNNKNGERWKNIVLDNTKFCRTFNWEPKVNIEEGLKNIITEQEQLINE